MPIVVVHGVNTRKDEPGYKARQALIASLLGAHIAGATVNGKVVTDTKPDFPYWGDFATSFGFRSAGATRLRENTKTPMKVAARLLPAAASTYSWNLLFWASNRSHCNAS